MADIMLISQIFGSIKAAIEIAKLLKESDLSLEKAEMKLKLADLISTLADTKIQVAEIQDVLLEKDGEIKKLQEALTIKEIVTYEPPFYWTKDGERKDGPYCQRCYDKDKILVRLQDYGDGRYVCEVCDKSFDTPERQYRKERQEKAVMDYDPFGR
jgi:hypothetical protein